ncbi:MAG: restriction endonuclease [Gallionella sp.]
MVARTMYEIEIRHEGLGKYRHIRGSDRHVVIQKAEAQKRAWEDAWYKKQAIEDKYKQRLFAMNAKEAARQQAAEQTDEAQAVLESLRNTINHTLSINDAIDWESLKEVNPFRQASPIMSTIPKPVFEAVPTEPLKEMRQYQPRLGLLGWLIPSIRTRRIYAADKLFEVEHQAWLLAKRQADELNTVKQSSYELDIEKLEKKFEGECLKYDEKRKEYFTRQKESNDALDIKKTEYLAGKQGAIIDYCELVLANSEYPESFPKEFDIEYLPDTKMLLVDYALPSREQIPSLKEVKYIQTKNEFKTVFLSDKELDALYDELIYQISLRTLHELFEADVVNVLDAIVLNGLVTGIEKATGNTVTNCILSIQASKDEFMAIKLANVDPKVCFKALKGVGSSKLHSMVAVAPILKINKEDRRFVDGYAVVGNMDSSTNLAMMDWEDFEHLIRELFEEEFRQGGGEVKITQASRDGGVDAVAFDPDPIRGGKIVIQAKRYTNTVSVSAVRDLYGTVMNEGATKGILVSTANYGPDAYEFAKGKPLTLLNGANLLHLLEKHGHRARIDLQEAKRMLA